MSICFVIQPFDSGKFDKRYDDTFEPAIRDAGLQPYRVDRDPSVEIPIASIEDGIRKSSICLADISTDNPNVWYELGFAFASNRSVILVCSDERDSPRFPFDIQHRKIIKYKTESSQDFDKLKAEISQCISHLQRSDGFLSSLAAEQQISPHHGLRQVELAVLGAIASNTNIPGFSVSVWAVKNDMERYGFTTIASSLGVRGLVSKEFIETLEETDEQGESYAAILLTERGWRWIEDHESLFELQKDEAIPF
jgi:hypothetical protein